MNRLILSLKLGIALLALVGVCATAWAQGLTLTVTITQSPSAPLADISCDEDRELTYTATFDNPFSGSSSCSITDPDWTWTVASVTLNGNSPPADSYSMVESQTAPGSDVFHLTFSGHMEGDWNWNVTADVTATNTCDENEATGTKTISTTQQVGGEAELFTVETHPNSKVSWPRDDKFVFLPKSIQVLKGWKCRYTAPAGYMNVTWKADGKAFGPGGSPMEYEQKDTGTFKVTMHATKVGKKKPYTLGPRTMVVSELEADSFVVEEDGKYFLDPGTIVKSPAQAGEASAPAIKWDGRVRVKLQKTEVGMPPLPPLPPLTDFKWGYVQSVTGVLQCYRDDLDYKWSAGSKANSYVFRPIDIHQKSPIPKDRCDNLFNLEGVLLLSDKDWALNTKGSLNDTPSTPNPIVRKYPTIVKDKLGNFKVDLDLAGKPKMTEITYTGWHTVMALKFRLWIVGYHTTTKQYVPLREVPWELDFDSLSGEAAWLKDATVKDEADQLSPLPNPKDSAVPYLPVVNGRMSWYRKRR